MGYLEGVGGWGPPSPADVAAKTSLPRGVVGVTANVERCDAMQERHRMLSICAHLLPCICANPQYASPTHYCEACMEQRARWVEHYHRLPDTCQSFGAYKAFHNSLLANSSEVSAKRGPSGQFSQAPLPPYRTTVSTPRDQALFLPLTNRESEAIPSDLCLPWANLSRCCSPRPNDQS